MAVEDGKLTPANGDEPAARVGQVPRLIPRGIRNDLKGDSSAPIQAQEPLGISGKWAGMGVNSDGNKGTASLMVKEHKDGTLTGKWGAAGSEMTIEKGERVTPQ